MHKAFLLKSFSNAWLTWNCALVKCRHKNYFVRFRKKMGDVWFHVECTPWSPRWKSFVLPFTQLQPPPLLGHCLFVNISFFCSGSDCLILTWTCLHRRYIKAHCIWCRGRRYPLARDVIKWRDLTPCSKFIQARNRVQCTHFEITESIMKTAIAYSQSNLQTTIEYNKIHETLTERQSWQT